MAENHTRERVLAVLQSHPGKWMNMFEIAREAGVHWHTALRIVSELIFDDLEAKDPELRKRLIVVPEKTPKSWVFRPQLQLNKVEEVV